MSTTRNATAVAALLWAWRRITRAAETDADRGRRELRDQQRHHQAATARLRPEQVRTAVRTEPAPNPASTCTCGWTLATGDGRGHCFLCHDAVPGEEALDHFRVMHPDEFETLCRWPDGTPVVEDATLEPEDFR